ncbi:MAG: hypothetical protein AAFR59_06540 [Bacteroidota bacterium]
MNQSTIPPEGPLTIHTIKQAIDDAYAEKPNTGQTFWSLFQQMLRNGLDYSEGNPIKISAEYWEEVDKAQKKKGKRKKKCGKRMSHRCV